MEKVRPRRSKITSIADRSSGERFASAERAFRGGNRQLQTQKNFPKLASDSSSCSSGSTAEDSFTFELGWRSSKQVVGTPIKKLLAEEMLRESEPRRRSPSVIAKLMGLDGLPPQQLSHRPQKGISENCHQRTRSAEKEHRSSICYDRRSSRKNSKEQQEFKDVFEVFETSKRTANSKLSDAEMAFVRQKFMDAKRLSTDERLQDSKEFHDALEVLDSNKDLLLKFLQQPDSMFSKHLHELQGGPQSRCGRIASMKSSQAQKYENIDLSRTSMREPPRKNYCKSPQTHRDSFSSHSDCRHAARSSLKSSQSRSEAKIESAVPPTRIVVLKPNLAKVLNAAKTVSSPCSSHASMLDGRKHTEFPSISNREAESLGRKKFQDNDDHLRHKSRESREVAKEITRQMRNNFSIDSVRFSSSGLKGYAGDESSCSMSDNESANDESEVMSVASRHSFHLNNHSRPSSSCSTESSVSREAKKRLSERWNMTHKPQEVGVISRGSTLAEMLAIPDKETRATNLDARIGEAGFKDKFSSEHAPARWGGPLGISSRDGWKDGCIKSLSRSKSLPASSSSFESYKTSMCHEPICDDRYLIQKEIVKHERNIVKGNLDLREGARRNSRSSNKRSYSSRSLSREAVDMSPETHTTQSKEKTNFEENNRSLQNIEAFKSSPSNAIDTSPASVKLADVDASMSFEAPDVILPEFSSRLSVEGSSCGGNQDNLISQEPSIMPPDEGAVPSDRQVPGIESPASSKEADQPSPVSVLEVPFVDDVSSSSECFESLSADLQGLRMQLQLLKLESESYAEGPMEVSSDEDAGEGSTRALRRDEESWESLYLADILSESGLNNAGPDTFLATWHTPECPVSPLLFEELEKRYCDQTYWPKSERKLLFDRINSGLLEMFEQFTDPHPWVRPANKRIGPQWIDKSAVEEVLCKLLASQEENANEDDLEKVLGRESKWLDLGDEIDEIGREVERSLIDELVAEVVVM